MVANRLGNGLQNRLDRFDSGPRLHFFCPQIPDFIAKAGIFHFPWIPRFCVKVPADIKKERRREFPAAFRLHSSAPMPGVEHAPWRRGRYRNHQGAIPEDLGSPQREIGDAQLLKNVVTIVLGPFFNNFSLLVEGEPGHEINHDMFFRSGHSMP